MRVYYFLKDANMFKHMEIAEYIYENVLGPCYKKLLGKMPTMLVTEY